jgi:hypothetical protein
MLVRLSVAMFKVDPTVLFVVNEVASSVLSAAAVGAASFSGSSSSSSGATSSATLIAASSALLIVLTSDFIVSPSLYSHLIATVRSSRPLYP